MSQSPPPIQSSIVSQAKPNAVQASNMAQQLLGKPFNSILEEAIGKQGQAIMASQGTMQEKKRPVIDPVSDDKELLMAQVIPDDIRNEQEKQNQIELDDRALKYPELENFQSRKLDITPFQILIDKAISSLENISEMEFKMNDLMEQYTRGQSSIDEVTIETAKLNLAISFASSVITSATTTFKEFIGMQI